MTAFKDHFSSVTQNYATYRPQYPAGLYAWLASHAPAQEQVWDCACGTGQASLGLAEHFQQVIASDASASQIAAAPEHPRIEWRVAPAEHSGLADACIDLVTVAQALHWFDLDAFYAEVKRVLKPGGVLAVWTYGVLKLSDPAVDTLVQHFYRDVLGSYWPPERAIVEQGYRTLPFPFAEFEPAAFSMQLHWNRAQLLGYLRSWSANDRYIKANGHDPVTDLEQALAAIWPVDTTLLTEWPLSIRIGR